MTDPTCEESHQLIAELALGVLDGRERAAVLGHVEHCSSCQTELRSMGDVADRLIELAPPAEPPAGFETRVLQGLAVARTEVRAGRRVRRPAAGRAVGRLSAAAVLAVVIGVGGWAVGRAGAPTVTTGPARVATASLVVGGSSAGQVVLSGGHRPLMALAVDSDLGDRTVRCDLVGRDGRTTTIATYTLSHGSGYWALPITVAPASVSAVRLVDTAGQTVATASFPAP